MYFCRHDPTHPFALARAGRSASSLITYILRHAPAERWFLTVADAQPAHLAPCWPRTRSTPAPCLATRKTWRSCASW
ncbi:hypothetical protein [Hymenobacter sp. BRD67]|uniref:hypothetical protein n=1 Tax=Hymenobacter sp. BRD67 TaxID=2675877 RepID=UPI0020B6FA74|nr:hypothetical protein [Hymenobacter sp. BRD67]